MNKLKSFIDSFVWWLGIDIGEVIWRTYITLVASIFIIMILTWIF